MRRIAYKLEMKLDQPDCTSRMPPFPKSVETILSASQGYDRTPCRPCARWQESNRSRPVGRVLPAEHELVPAGGQNDLGRGASQPHEVSAQMRLAARSRCEGQPTHACPERLAEARACLFPKLLPVRWGEALNASQIALMVRGERARSLAATRYDGLHSRDSAVRRRMRRTSGDAFLCLAARIDWTRLPPRRSCAN